MNKVDFLRQKENMVIQQIRERGITNEKISNAFRTVDRHLFVPPSKVEFAYEDYPLPIGCGQTISQPYIVALMSEVLDAKFGDKVLEIGTGSGYQAAILACLGLKVYSIERIEILALKAKSLLQQLKFDVEIKVGDGTLGWQEHSFYDRIIVTAAAPSISPYWIEQVCIGGKIVVPKGNPLHQELVVAEKISPDKVKEEVVCGCVFVPLIGKYGYNE